MSLFDRLFPGFLDARRELARTRPPHFRPLAGLTSVGVRPLEDLPLPEVERINERSRQYFEREGMREFWLNKPFSDPAWTGWTLTRFGQLLTALDLRPGDRVLDFGCGTGWSTVMLARMGLDVVGMDVSPTALAIGTEAAEGLPAWGKAKPRFELFPGDRVPYDDGTFDAIVVFEAFHHLPNPRQILGEFARVLAPNSRLGLAEPGVGHSASVTSKAEMEQGVLEREVDLEQLHQSALAAGFAGTEVVVPGLHPHAVTLPMRRLRWYLRGLSWLVPADQVRLAILSSPIALLWKGPCYISSLHPRNQAAVIRPARPRVTCFPSEALTVEAEVRNAGATTWLKDGRHGRGNVQLGAHLLDERAQLIEWDYGRAGLPADLPMHACAILRLGLRAPGAAGRYLVRLDMVNEGIGWFAEGRSQVAEVELTVEAGGRRTGDAD